MVWVIKEMGSFGGIADLAILLSSSVAIISTLASVSPGFPKDLERNGPCTKEGHDQPLCFSDR